MINLIRKVFARKNQPRLVQTSPDQRFAVWEITTYHLAESDGTVIKEYNNRSVALQALSVIYEGQSPKRISTIPQLPEE